MNSELMDAIKQIIENEVRFALYDFPNSNKSKLHVLCESIESSATQLQDTLLARCLEEKNYAEAAQVAIVLCSFRAYADRIRRYIDDVEKSITKPEPE